MMFALSPFLNRKDRNKTSIVNLAIIPSHCYSEGRNIRQEPERKKYMHTIRTFGEKGVISKLNCKNHL